MISPGKFRHLNRSTTPSGHFCILAIDHRDNLLEKLNQHAPTPLDDRGFTAFKQAILKQLAPLGSAVLVDPAYGIGTGIYQRTLDAHAGLLAPIEVTDYGRHPSERDLDFIPHWGVDKIKKVGGDGVKLLLPYHPEAHNAAEKRAQVQDIIDQCNEHDIPFFLEPIAYSLDPAKKLPNAELRQIVVEMAKTFSKMGADILKMQFPVDATQSFDEGEWEAACIELNAACGAVPWALLSAGVSFEVFARQARVACRAGASGVIVGRAVWAEAVELQGEARQSFIEGIASNRMHELSEICAMHAQPWFDRVETPDVSANWYESY